MMKTRLICLFLCLIMLVATFASCSKKTVDEALDETSKEASENAMTLSMWVVAESAVAPETAALVSQKLNSITESKFKTHLVVNFLTEEEYRTKLSETIAAYEATKGSAPETETTTESGNDSGETTVVTDETMKNEYGMSVIKYPDLIANQVDIIYIAGQDMYIDFIDKGWLAELDTELSSSSKKIKEYVSPTLLSSAQYDGKTYAVPNNRAIGEYTYMLLNKELMDKYSQQGYIQTGKIDGFYNEYLYSFLNLIHQFEDPAKVIPVEASYKQCLDLLAHYWSIDPDSHEMLDEFSIFGYRYKNMEELSRGSVILGYDSLFGDPEFVEDYLKLNKMRFDGYLGEVGEGQTSAVKFVKGDSQVLADYKDDYYAVVVEYPTASATDIYGNMFGVCAYTKSVSRSMEIVTYLNTNSDFRNILQYGVENTHYRLLKNEQGSVIGIERLTNSYMMNIFATGNAFIAYPEPDMSYDIWEESKLQNRESLVNPLLGLDFPTFAAGTAEDKGSETVIIDKDKGYAISYTTGHNKSVLSQNEVLAQWIADCDRAGNGVYLLQTTEISGQNMKGIYYVYNNNLPGKIDFTVQDIHETEKQTNEKGEEVVVQTNLDFVMTYTDGYGIPTRGYELSIVTLHTKKNNSFEFLCKVNGQDTALNITTAEQLVDFDLMNTQGYSIESYNKLPKVLVYKNKLLDNWIDACDSFQDNKPTYYIMNHKSEVVDGKRVTTYVVYRTGLTHVMNMVLVPTLEGNKLTLNFNFTYRSDEKLDLNSTEITERDVNYLLYYVRVSADENIEVLGNYTTNGKVDELLSTDVVTPSADPDFRMVGQMDTELVKYLYDLNTMVNNKLNACQTYEEFEAVVAELQILLAATDKIPTVRSFDKIKDIVSKLAVNGNLTHFHDDLRRAVSHELIKELNAPEASQLAEYYLDVNGHAEPYVYLYSPYGIYYSWLQTYNFLPKETTEKK